MWILPQQRWSLYHQTYHNIKRDNNWHEKLTMPMHLKNYNQYCSKVFKWITMHQSSSQLPPLSENITSSLEIQPALTHQQSTSYSNTWFVPTSIQATWWRKHPDESYLSDGTKEVKKKEFDHTFTHFRWTFNKNGPMVMSFVCSKHEQTTTRNAQLPWKALLLAKTEITGEPALVLKLDYARKWIYAEELSSRSCAWSTCGGFLANVKVKQDKSRTGKWNTSKRNTPRLP